jgi:eukaryotic-like serine/threonine-protein kinase
MDPERWARVKELFHAALACEPERRAAFLARTTGGDESLRSAVEAMLARQPEADRFLKVPAVEAAAMAIAADLDQAGTAGDRSQSPPAAVPALPPGHLANRPRPSSLPPWWMVLLAAVFLCDALLRAWCWTAGPEGLGLKSRLWDGRRVVTEVVEGGVAERAGIRPGDIVLRRDGQPYERVASSFHAQPNLEVGRIYRFEIERDGQRRMAEAIPGRRLRAMLGPPVSAHALWQVAMLAMLPPAFLIAFARPRNPLARLGALTLASLGIGLYVFNLPPGYAAAVRGLPFGLGALALVPNLAVALAGPIGLTFFLRFPRPLFRARWPWLLVWLPAVSILPAYVQAMFVVYRPGHPVFGSVRASLAVTAFAVFAAYGLAMVAAIVANYVHLTGSNDRRRVRLLVAGGAIGTLPALVRLLLKALAPESAARLYLESRVPDLLIVVGFLLFPASFTYALLRHRVLGVRVIVRMAVQYALARGIVVSLVPILGFMLAADALLHGSEPLIDIVRARGWIYAALAGLAIVVHTQRSRIAAAIDRRFFREHYDARHLLREVAEQARRAGSLDAAALAVVTRLEAALQPTFAALLARSSGMTFFRTVAVAPAGARPPLLREDDAIVTALRSTEKPVQTSWWYPLGEEERRLGGREAGARSQEWGVGGRESGVGIQETWGRQVSGASGDAGPPVPIELAVPIVVSVEKDEALLAFGPRRSEEPYTQEDIDSAAAIAASLALFAAPPSGDASRPASAFGECPACGTCYDEGAGRCANGGERLVPVSMPRTLAERYRLERRLGRGGMGKVYEATDTALGRRVAVKVIRDEWVHSAVAIQRFRREARAIAGFTHPNLVTVHDYGVETGRRAFIVMELLQGITLGDELRRAGRLDTARTLEVFRGVCSVVEAAHRHRIVHRDLKPDNIFLLDSEHGGGVKVLDFGVAKVLAGPAEQAEPGYTTQTAIGVLVGTVGYLSPEQLLGEPPDVSCDLWALAVVAYECLTGALPFPVTSRDAWRHLVLSGRPVPLREHLPDAPATWQEFFDRSLSPDRTRRPRSATEFFRQLQTASGAAVGASAAPASST